MNSYTLAIVQYDFLYNLRNNRLLKAYYDPVDQFLSLKRHK